MVTVTEQYEAFPYPERDPEDEARRLITGSPSDPREIDHFLFGGARDWSRPMRILIAGGGTGDGLIQLAQQLSDAGCPAEFVYLDLSRAARAIAEGRAEKRGLTGIAFHTDSLLNAAKYGAFDYIDCCGVLHHLPEPEAGLAALRRALAPGGGMGFMVYAPLGRSGVYPLQAAFGTLFEGLPPEERLSRAKAVMDRVPDGHPFKRNPHLVDHRQSDAGFYDLLLHGQDRAFSVPELCAALDRSGWQLVDFTMPGLYDLAAFAEPPPDMGKTESMGLAEALSGTIKTHVGYAVPAGSDHQPPTGQPWAKLRKRTPQLKGAAPKALAERVAAGSVATARFGGVSRRLEMPRACAPLLAEIDGRRTVGEIAKKAKVDPPRAAAAWARIEEALCPWGLLLYSRLAV